MTTKEEIIDYLDNSSLVTSYVPTYGDNVFVVNSDDPRLLQQKMDIKFDTLLDMRCSDRFLFVVIRG